MFVFNVPPTAKVIMETGPQLKVSSDRLVKPGIEPANPGLQGKRFIHFTTVAPKLWIRKFSQFYPHSFYSYDLGQFGYRFYDLG